MKNYFIVILMSIVLFQISVENIAEDLTDAVFLTSQRANNKLKLDVVRNYVDSNVVLYLSVNDKITDSLRIDFLNFKTDSLISINDTIWHYIYSFQNIHPDAKLVQQMVITEKNNKIHLAYASDYVYYEWFEYHLSDSFFCNNPSVRQNVQDKRGYMVMHNDTSKEYTSGDTIRNGEYIIMLKYDPYKKVYYQQSEFLKGSFSVSGKYLQTNGQFNNEKVLSIKFVNTKMIFWENKWFQCNIHYNDKGLDFNLIPFEETYKWRYL